MGTSIWGLPIVSIVVPFFGLTNFVLGILKGKPQKGTTMKTIGRVWGFEV